MRTVPDAMVFRFLNRLRESGATNMFGAAPFIENEFGMSISESRKVLARWMNWVNEDPENLNV